MRPVAAARLIAGLVALVLVAAPAAPARAESAAQAQAAARRAAVEVVELSAAADAALTAYDRALAAVGSSIGRDLSGQAAADEAAQAERVAVAESAGRLRALYMSGGQSALVSGLVASTDLRDLTSRIVTADRILATGTEDAAEARERADTLARRAARLRAAADRSVVTASDVATRAAALAAVLAREQAALDQLSTRARSLADAERAAAALRAQRERAARALAQRVATVKARVVPTDYFALYRAAAPTCPGLSWTVLAAIGQVESGHGRNVGPSPHGAMGPMQFLPSTFRAYAVDGDRDGDADILDPADAIFSAAHYLCRNGAGGGGAALERAVWHYNHADWYVRMVLSVAGQISSSAAAAPAAEPPAAAATAPTAAPAPSSPTR